MARSSPPSLRTELLVNLALLAATALALGAASVLMVYEIMDPRAAAIAIIILIAADVAIFLGFVAYQVDRVVLRPLRSAMSAAEAIADGDLVRRLEPGASAEMANLSASVNRMTDRLIQDRAQLGRAEKLASIGRFASGIAHEIGNPLGAINGYAHVLRSAAPGSGHAAQALDGLDREAARIDRIIRGLLDYARARPRSSTDVDLGDTIRSMIDLLAGQGVLRNVTLDLHLPQAQLQVAADRQEVEQSLVNLVLNAVDAMEGRGTLGVVARRVSRVELLTGAHRASDVTPVANSGADAPADVVRWLQRADTEELATVAILDSGPGVPQADVERIFEPFYTTKEPGKGTGLGLAIAARSVENCGGIIWASRSREGGAAFRILLPLLPVRAAAGIAASAGGTRA